MYLALEYRRYRIYNSPEGSIVIIVRTSRVKNRDPLLSSRIKELLSKIKKLSSRKKKLPKDSISLASY